MSILAGVYSRNGKNQIPEKLCDSLKKNITRHADDDIRIFKNERIFFAKVDIGAFGENGFYADESGISMLAGEPLLTDEISSRENDLIEIHKNFDVLNNARGVFSAASFQNDALYLTSDKLGIRPLYYFADDDFIIFASALRILEDSTEIPKKMNLRAVTEIAGLGYALRDRTPYENVFLLRAGEIVEFKNREISASFYWRWDEIETSKDPEENLTEELYRRFENAVARRLRSDKTTVAYLSGGLDSRCIVGALRGLDAQVHTFNFALPHTQDLILGGEFAEKSGAIHTEIPKQAGDLIPDYSAKMADAWCDSKNRPAHPAERPALVWSGEGGSVALGHVHLARRIAELMNEGKTQAAIDEFIERENIYVSPKMLRAEISQKLAGIVRKGIGEELGDSNSEEAARQFYLFLMLNDQHRKLFKHFENIDLHRLEFHLPFFDSDFLELIVSAPVEMCLEHKLYVKWLYLFPESVTSVAWQSYPGHEPCPIPVSAGLSYQWDGNYQAGEQNALKKSLIGKGKEMLRAKDFPAEILNKNNLRIALLIYQTGWRDYSYIFETAEIYQKFWRKSQGSYGFGLDD